MIDTASVQRLTHVGGGFSVSDLTSGILLALAFCFGFGIGVGFLVASGLDEAGEENQGRADRRQPARVRSRRWTRP